MKQKPRVVVVSGGFDPIHIGHVRMFKHAKELGDTLVVLLNNDHWLRAKKGYVFMPQKERKEILEALSGVDRVVYTSHKANDADRSVCRDLRKLRPHIFANGGDRTNKNIPEVALCKKLGIQMIFSVGKGGKVQSSSWLVDTAASKKSKS